MTFVGKQLDFSMILLDQSMVNLKNKKKNYYKYFDTTTPLSRILEDRNRIRESICVCNRRHEIDLIDRD